MTSEIFIENKQVDISEGLSNLLTYAIDDIKDIGSKNTSFSKTIILPGTARNNALFGHIFDVTVMNTYNPALPNTGYNFNASKQAAAIIFQNHIQVFKGILRLLKIVINSGVPEYEVAVFGELGGLVNAMGNAKLQDLDFSIYDHILNVPNVSGSWNNVTGGGYYYPLADYGQVSNNKIDYDITTFRPALFVKEYIEKIFTAAGYTFDSAIMETARFKSLIIPHNQKQLTKNNVKWIDAEKIDIGDYDILAGSGNSQASYEFTGWDVVNFTVAGPGQTFTYTGPNNMPGRLVLNLHGDITNTGSDITYAIRINGTAIVTGTLDDTAGATEEWQAIEDVPYVLATGDVVDVRFEAVGGGPYNVGSDVGTLQFITEIPAVVPIGNGDDVQMNDTIPRNILQRDFLSSVLKLFNLYAYEDNLKDKFLNITPYVDFYNASGVVDWTYKMDRSRQIELVPMSELNARYYNFKFKPDTDYYNELYSKRYGEGYGDYLFDSEFAFSGDVADIPLIFSATPLVGYSGADKIVSTYYKQDSPGIENPVDTNIRILQAKLITGISAWSILDVATVLQPGITSYGYAGHYNDPDVPSNDIHFGVPRELFFTLLSGGINVTQFNLYWSSYMAEITDKDSKLLTAWFKLTNSDIYNLDFSKFIYIDGSYFRLNKIIDWNASDPEVCKCELLKVIYNQY